MGLRVGLKITIPIGRVDVYTILLVLKSRVTMHNGRADVKRGVQRAFELRSTVL